MPDYNFSTIDGNVIRQRFEAKLARMKARGVRVIPGSTFWTKLWAAAYRG